MKKVVIFVLGCLSLQIYCSDDGRKTLTQLHREVFRHCSSLCGDKQEAVSPLGIKIKRSDANYIIGDSTVINDFSVSIDVLYHQSKLPSGLQGIIFTVMQRFPINSVITGQSKWLLEGVLDQWRIIRTPDRICMQREDGVAG